MTASKTFLPVEVTSEQAAYKALELTDAEADAILKNCTTHIKLKPSDPAAENDEA
ncbi:TPA: hypothetical protein ACK3Q6_008065 [Burkholderia cepacia]